MSSPSPVTSSGTSGSNSNNSSNNNTGGNRNRKARRHTGKAVATKFEGEIAELKGYVYDCVAPNQADQYIRTTKHIANHFSSTTDKAGVWLNAILTLTLPVVPPVTRPTPRDDGTYDAMDQLEYGKRFDRYEKKVELIEDLNHSLYPMVWSQCSDAIRERLKRHADYATFSTNHDGIGLLRAIKSISHNVLDINYPPETMHDALHSLITFKQSTYMSVENYHEQFINRRDTYILTGGHSTASPIMLRMIANKHNVVDANGELNVNGLTAEQRAEAFELDMATLFLRNADKHRFGQYQTALRDGYLDGDDKYPATVYDAYTRLLFRSKQTSQIQSVNANDGVAFATRGVSSNDDDTNDGEGVTLATHNQNTSNKGKKGNTNTNKQPNKNNRDKDDSDNGGQTEGTTGNHSSSNNVNAYTVSSSCPPSNANSINLNSNLFSTLASTIPSTWILLDNQSTVDVFCEPSLLTDIHDSDSTMTIKCNAGAITTTKVGTFHDYGDVWYCENGIANILSFANAREKGYHIDYNSDDNVFILRLRNNSSDLIFRQSPNGLYYHDTAYSVMLVNTVEDNKGKFSQRDITRAQEARDLMIKIGRPSLQQFLHILDNNQLPNCPVTRRDALIAQSIFGPDLGSLKGKTVYRPPEPVQLPQNDLPVDIMNQYKDVTLCGDIMFVNKTAFFVTISRHIHFGTVEMIANRRADTVLNSIKSVLHIYKQRGFNVSHLLMDGEFEPLRGALAGLGIQLNMVTNQEHVPEVERYIRTLKERVRCIYNTLPFEHMAPRLLIEMVKASNFWLNAFPHRNGISDVLSPRQIVTGSTIDFNRHCRLSFGTYVQTHEEHDNTMTARTIGALALRPTGNAQGGFYFYSLSTGRVISRNRWTELPMPHEVIERVHTLSRRANAARGPLAFYDRYGIPIAHDDDDAGPDDIDDDSDDASFHPDDDHHTDDNSRDSDSGSDATNDDNDDANDDDNDDDNIDEDNVSADDDNDGIQAHAVDIAPNVAAIPLADVDHDNIFEVDPALADNNNPNLPVDIPGVDDVPVEIPGVGDLDVDDVPAEIPGVDDLDPVAVPEVIDDQVDIDPGDINAQMDEAYGTRTGAYDLRPRRHRTYEHLFTQHSTKKGLKIFGARAVAAIIKELRQLHNLKVIIPVDPKTLSAEQIRGALQYLMFLKEKRCGTVKGRGCADGRKQRTYMSKEDTSSPTVAIESVYLSCVIDADEERDVAIVDVPGAFLHADMNEIVYMRIDADMAKLLVEIDPDLYGPFLTYTRDNQPVLYVRLQKALYGTLQAALLFWEKLSGLLQSWGFVLNPYDKCVANKNINGSICTILWHVDDLKISHVDPNVVSEIIQQLSDEFGHVSPLTVHRGKKHDYLGMQIDFSSPSKVRISMCDYISKILADAPSDMSGTAPTPAANHLFTVNESNPTLLSAADAEQFHHMVAQLLFLCKRARPDIQTAVSFLCTRVQRPDTDDYKKLARVIKYLRGTIALPLTLQVSDTKLMQWWIDASYGVHPDMKSHTGGVLTLGKGAVYATSTRQKINTKSSTEAELVGVNDVLPQVLWTKYFLQEQGYHCTESVIYQDNQSALLLEKNGRASSSKRTRHINIRYYFVTDKIKNKEVSLEYCPTESMIADFFTKPLQGKLFKTFRDFILNIDPATDVVLLHVATGPHPIVSSTSTGHTFLQSVDHRSVLDGSSAGAVSDWLLVTRHHKAERHHKIHLKSKVNLKQMEKQMDASADAPSTKVENNDNERELILS